MHTKNTIKTNNQFRSFLQWNDLTQKEQKEMQNKEFDKESLFFRHKGKIYNLNDFASVLDFGRPQAKYDAKQETREGTVFIKLSECADKVKIGFREAMA